MQSGCASVLVGVTGLLFNYWRYSISFYASNQGSTHRDFLVEFQDSFRKSMTVCFIMTIFLTESPEWLDSGRKSLKDFAEEFKSVLTSSSIALVSCKLIVLMTTSFMNFYGVNLNMGAFSESLPLSTIILGAMNIVASFR